MWSKMWVLLKVLQSAERFDPASGSWEEKFEDFCCCRWWKRRFSVIFSDRNPVDSQENAWNIYHLTMFDLDFRANNGLLFFPKQFNVGVINSLLRDVRLFPGVVQLSGCAEVHLSPSLAAGVRLFGCVAALVSNHLSLTICLVLHLSPKLFVSNRMSALVVVSCSFIMILFMFCFVLVSVLYCLCVFLLYQDKIMFHHGFLCFTTCLPLVSYFVSLLLSQIQLPLLVIHAVLSWHGPKIASIRSYYNHKHAFRYCNGYGRTVWSLRECIFLQWICSTLSFWCGCMGVGQKYETAIWMISNWYSS